MEVTPLAVNSYVEYNDPCRNYAAKRREFPRLLGIFYIFRTSIGKIIDLHTYIPP
jgi:hypothetical protein